MYLQLYLVKWPSKVSNEQGANTNNGEDDKQQLESVSDVDDKQPHIDDDKYSNEIAELSKQLETYQSIITQLTEKQTDLEDHCQQQAELLSKAQDHVSMLEKESKLYWVGFVCMFLIVLADVVYNLFLLY